MSDAVMALKWVILNVVLPVLVVLGIVRFFLRRMIATFFKLKAARYLEAARFNLAYYPPGTIGYQSGNLLLAMGELYYNLAKAFCDEGAT